MKLLIPSFLLLLAVACVPIKPLTFPRIDDFSYLDLRQYSQKGFLFTTESYTEQYESIAVVRYFITQEATYSKFIDEYGLSQVKWDIKKINTSEVLDSLYTKAVALGGDAVISMKFDYDKSSVPSNYGYAALTVSGLAIKRKK
jgi:uncharacterized protein YbjQ (UPF0145 family)